MTQRIVATYIIEFAVEQITKADHWRLSQPLRKNKAGAKGACLQSGGSAAGRFTNINKQEKTIMNWKLKVAFICHLLALLLLIAFGLIYLLRPEFMPYHAIAVGISWEEVDPAFQILILALMKVTGGGFLASAFAIGLLLFKAFRRGQQWSYWAIPAIGLIASISSLYVTIHVAVNTPATPPWIAAALGIILLSVGFVFSVLPDAKTVQ